MTTVNEFNTLIDAITKTKGRIKDDHGNENSYITVAGIALVNRGDNHVAVPLFNASYYSLNELYMGRDGQPHISTNSVAGVVKKFELSVEESILLYNEQQVKNLFTPPFLHSVYLLVDGELVSSEVVSAKNLEDLITRAEMHKQVKEEKTDTYRASEA